MIERIFWRHGEALWGLDDLSRPLSARGKEQASASAYWLKKTVGEGVAIYSSYACRAQETAAFYDVPKLLKGLNPDGAFSLVEQALASIHEERAIVVGHLPWIGQIVGQYLNSERDYMVLATSEVYVLAFDGVHWQLRGHYMG